MWPSTAQRAYTPAVAQIQALSISTPKIQRFPTRKSQISSPSQRYCIDTIRQDSRTCEVCVGTHITSYAGHPLPHAAPKKECADPTTVCIGTQAIVTLSSPFLKKSF